jgi:hypothetical protein
MKNLMMATFAISILISGVMGCQNPPNRIRSNNTLGTASNKSAKFSPALKGDPSQLDAGDAILVQIIYLGYNQSPATVDRSYIGVSLSTASMTDINIKTAPAQKVVIPTYTEKTQSFADGTKGVKFTMRLPWSDIQDDLKYVNSDTTKPFFFNWQLTPEKGTGPDSASALYFSVNLSDRLKNSMKYSGNLNLNPDIKASVSKATSDIANYAKGDLAKELQALLITDGYAATYPVVALDSSSSDGNSFYYVGISVNVAPPLPTPAPTAVPSK